MVRKVFAFLKKDLLVESSYRLSFALNFFGVFVGLAGYFFIDRLFGHRMAPGLQEFGVGYFPYVLLAMAFFGYAGAGMGALAARIRAEQTGGTLEALLVTPTPVSTILVSMAAFNFLIATIDMALYIALGVLVFGIDFSGANLVAVAAVFGLTIVSFGSLGILSASFIVIFKRGNPVGWFIGSVEGLVGGVYFPVAIMPAWLQYLSKLLPITYAIRALELAVYKGYSIVQLFPEIAALILFSAFLLPASFASFSYALRKSRKDGTLAQY